MSNKTAKITAMSVNGEVWDVEVLAHSSTSDLLDGLINLMGLTDGPYEIRGNPQPPWTDKTVITIDKIGTKPVLGGSRR